MVFHPSRGIRARAFEIFDFEHKVQKFKCSTLIVNFDLQDLISDDVMLLDSGDEVYVWVGKEAEKVNIFIYFRSPTKLTYFQDEIDSGLAMAKQFLDSDPTPR